MWIGSAKNNETKPLGFKSLGINLSYKHKNNDDLNCFIKMDTKLNIWQTRDLGHQAEYMANKRPNFIWTHNVG